MLCTKKNPIINAVIKIPLSTPLSTSHYQRRYQNPIINAWGSSTDARHRPLWTKHEKNNQRNISFIEIEGLNMNVVLQKAAAQLWRACLSGVRGASQVSDVRHVIETELLILILEVEALWKQHLT